jgi:hypothetical protein
LERKDYNRADRQGGLNGLGGALGGNRDIPRPGLSLRDINGSPTRVGNYLDPRSYATPAATRPATFGNIATALGMGPGPGLVANAGAMLAGYDPFSGPVGRTQRYNSDPPNRMGTGGPATGARAGGAWLSAPQLREYQRLLKQLAQAQAVVSVPLERVAYPSMPLQAAVPSRPAYGLTQPGYSFLAPAGTAAKASGYAGMPSLNPVGLPPQTR